METGIIKQLADELSARISPAVPVSAAFWGKKEIAACLSVSQTTVNRFITLPDFPAPYRFPVSARSSSKGYPRWPAKAVLAWADKYKGKEAAL